ncbi:hypothetical protein C8T65DRAFT_628330 [Cerioporus squamosus]|nr:hypothetical protein C8T65DRAFT_628330 [Cerioporus squamosus]
MRTEGLLGTPKLCRQRLLYTGQDPSSPDHLRTSNRVVGRTVSGSECPDPPMHAQREEFLPHSPVCTSKIRYTYVHLHPLNLAS